MYQNIIVATDGTDLGDLAVEHAAKLAKALDAALTIVTVTGPPPTFSGAEVGWSVPADVYEKIETAEADRAREILGSAVAAAADLGCTAASIHVTDQVPYAGILDAAKDIAADLIVMSSHGHRGLDRLILGSHASKVLTLSPLPVLVVK